MTITIKECKNPLNETIYLEIRFKGMLITFWNVTEMNVYQNQLEIFHGNGIDYVNFDNESDFKKVMEQIETLELIEVEYDLENDGTLSFICVTSDEA